METLKGRERIYVDDNRIDATNVIQVVERAMITHRKNATAIQILNKCERADMGLIREKRIRPEIDIKAIDPLPSQIVDFKVGFEHGEPIIYRQRANIDSGNPDGNEDEIKKDDLRVITLNQMMREINKATKDLRLAHHLKTAGIGFRYVIPRKSRRGIAPFDIVIPNPERTFLIYMNDAIGEAVAGVTYTQMNDSQLKRYGVYTKTHYYEWQDGDAKVRSSINPIGMIPIIEANNNEERMGSFERQLDLINAHNVVTSDRVNDICQQVQSILWLHNTKLDEDGKQKLANGGVIQTQANADGKDAKIQYVNAPLNQSQIQTLADSLKERILESAGVPKTSDATNATGEAMRVTNGWHTAETHAKASELLWRESEDAMLEVCLEYIKNATKMPNEVNTLQLSDIDYDMRRSEEYDISSRVNSFVALVNTGADIAKAAAYCKITRDPLQFATDSEKGINALRFNGISFGDEDKSRNLDEVDKQLDVLQKSLNIGLTLKDGQKLSDLRIDEKSPNLSKWSYEDEEPADEPMEDAETHPEQTEQDNEENNKEDEQ